MTSKGAPLIAIVEDEPDIVTYLSLALEDQGFEVLAIADARDAVRQLVSAQPDLICLDLLMPKYTGLSVYRELMSRPDLAMCPVVMTSGLTQRKDLSRLLEQAGGLPEPAAFIEKPISIAELLRVVEGLLGNAREAGP